MFSASATSGCRSAYTLQAPRASGERAGLPDCIEHHPVYYARPANPAERCIRRVETPEYPERGMEAIWRIEAVDFPAFIVIADKANDFFKALNPG